MPRTYTAVFNDGTAYLVEDVPDDVHPNDALKKTEREMGRPVTQFIAHGRGFWGEAKELGKDVLRGVGKAASTMMEGAAAFNDAEWGRSAPEGYTAMSDKVESMVPTPKNDTPERGYVRSALEGGSGALVGPGGASTPIRSMLTGGLAGLGGEAGSELSGGSAAGRIAGTLVGGMAGGAAGAKKLTRQDLAAEATKGLTDADLAAAQSTMQGAQRSGISLNAAQALGRPSNLDPMVEALANSKHGKGITAQLRSQPTDVGFAADEALSNLPGKVRTPQEVANSVQDAATANISAVKKARTALTDPLYQSAGDLGPQAPKALNATIERFVNSSGTSPKVIREARALQKELLESTADGKPRTGAMDIKAAIDDFRSGIKKTANPMDVKEQGQMKYLAKQLYDQLATREPLVGVANQVYGQLSKNVVDPLKKSVVGRMATNSGSQADKEAATAKVFAVLDKGTIPGASTSEILTLEKSLRNGGSPEVFQDYVKTWMAQKISEAATKTGGRASEGVASNLERAFSGNDLKTQGFKDAMVGVARSQGLPDDALVGGMQTMMKYIGLAAKRPGKVAGMAAEDLESAARNKVVGGAGNFTVLQPFRGVFRALDDSLKSDAYGFMDKLLTTPEGIETLRQLSKQPVMSKAAATTLATFLAGRATTEPQDARK